MLNNAQWNGLKRSQLFSGLSLAEAGAFLESVNVYPKHMINSEVIIQQGELPANIYLIITGTAQGEKLSLDGRVIIVNTFQAGDVFGDVLSGALEKSPVSVRMTQEGEILAIPFSALLRGEEGLIDIRERILRNLIGEIGKKYFALLRRTNLLTAPTLRSKIAVYLLENTENGEKTLITTHSREEQAQLFGCDRSALSRELSRMRKDGIIDLKGRHFEIKNRIELEKLAQ